MKKNLPAKRKHDPPSRPRSTPSRFSPSKVSTIFPPTKPISPPVIDPQLHQLNWLQRSTEVLLFSLHRLEYSLSPKGRLRQWFKLNLTVFTWLAIPVFLFIPLLNYILLRISTMAGSLDTTVQHLSHIFWPVIILLGILAFLIFILKS